MPPSLRRMVLAARLASLALLAAVPACQISGPPPSQEQQADAPPPQLPKVDLHAVPVGTLPPAHPVAPPSATELERKRAEWLEQQRAAEQAQNDLQAWQRSRRPAPGPQELPRVGVAKPGAAPADQAARAMHAWHRRYSARSAAVSLALSQFGVASAATPRDQPRLLAACRDLLAAAKALLSDPQALPAPTEDVSTSLASAYHEIQATAESCLSYRQDDQAAHMAAARQALGAASAALRPYGLVP